MSTGIGATVLARLAALVDDLTAAGLKATSDPEAARPSGVWVAPPRVVMVPVLSGATADALVFPVWAIASRNGSANELQALTTAVDAVLTAVELDPETAVEFGLILALPDGQFPAARLFARVEL